MLRQQTMRVTLDWSYALLSESERRLLRRLSVFVGGWRLEAAEAVCAGEGVTASEVLVLLLSLIDKSLVVYRREQHEVDGRYHLLEMVRQYAGESLQASGEAEQVQRRHQEWCLKFAEQAEPALKTDEQVVWLSRLETEHGNMQAALAWSLKIGIERGADVEKAQPLSPIPLRFCSALQRFWHMRAHLAEGRAWCERALQAGGAQERTAARAKVLNGAGRLIWMQGDYASSRACFEESLEIRREIGDQQSIATSLNSLGNAAHAQGDYGSARANFEESLEIYREIGDRQGIAASLHNLGNIRIAQGDHVAAQSYYEESLAIKQEIGDQHDIAGSIESLGNLALYLGDYVAAQAHYEESLAIYREIGDRRGIASALHNLGSVAHVQADYFAARTCHEESLAIRREIGDRRGIAIALNNMGNVICRLGDYVAAQSYYEESLAIQREMGNRQGIASALHNMGDMARNQGDYVAARAYHEESLAIHQEIGFWPGVVSSLDTFAGLIVAETTTPTSPMKMAEVSTEAGSGLWWAARLWGAARSLREQISAPLPPSEQKEYGRDVEATRAALDPMKCLHRTRM
jgi:tetratricopeptide (TPR) repeat protein